MPALGQIVQPLQAGERLSQEEFLRRWEALPLLKHAELIQGRVYLPSPVSKSHGSMHALVAAWLSNYASFTPGCQAGVEATWLMARDVPQPDAHLVILPDYKGEAVAAGPYHAGAPELAAEICLSSEAHDLGPKLELYRKSGVHEYLTIELRNSKVTWRYLLKGEYLTIEPDSLGVLRSRFFPGLWFDTSAILANDGPRIWDTLHQGLNTAEHGAFVKELASRARS